MSEQRIGVVYNIPPEPPKEANTRWFPAGAITASSPGENGPFFDPGADKAYRHPQFYKVPRGVRGV